MTEAPYQPEPVWRWDPDAKAAFAGINRPTAGARSQAELPRGRHPLQLYSLATPNGVKVSLLLEELLDAGYHADYDAWPIDIMSGAQFSSGFVAINPNSKIPALVDYSLDPGLPVFESGAILLYLAEKFAAFLPAGRERSACLSWLFWQMGSAPFLGGGFGHFYAYAPVKIKYAIDRYAMESKRQLDVLDQHLRDRLWLAGDSYSIADMAVWPWYGTLVLGELYGAAEFLQVQDYRHVLEWAQRIAQRPAVQRARRVNKTWGADALPERHDAQDFAGAQAS